MLPAAAALVVAWPCCRPAAPWDPNFHRPAAARRSIATPPNPCCRDRSPPTVQGAAQQLSRCSRTCPRTGGRCSDRSELDALVTRRCAPIRQCSPPQAALRQALENTAAQRGTYFPPCRRRLRCQRATAMRCGCSRRR